MTWSTGRRPAHYAPEIKALCEECYGELTTVIQRLGFLAEYQLRSVDQIEVWKRRRHDPNYRHRVVLIRTTGWDFRATDRSLAAPLESKAVMLERGEGGAYLNQDPLLVFENAAGAAQDLFFYNGMDEPKAMEYVACKQGGRFPSAKSARAAELTEEMENLLNLFAPAAEEGSGGR